MKVRLLDASETCLYDALARKHGKVFYSPDWRRVFGESLRSYGVFDDQGELAAGFQAVTERRFGVQIVRNPPCTPVIGPFMVQKRYDSLAKLEQQRKVLEAMATYLARIPRCIVSVSLDHEIHDGLPFQWHGFKTVPRYTYVIDLRRSLEEIVGCFSPTRRRNISAARRDGLEVHQETDLHRVEELVRSTFSRQRARLDIQVLRSILFQYATPQNSYACVTKMGNRVISCAFIVFDQSTAYYLLGGYDVENKHQGAGALALLECITIAQRRGLRAFDFEGSSIPAIERFFRGFGGELAHYLTVNRAWLPYEILLKFIRREMF